jgi:antirestriction protein ArdC
MSTTSRKAAAQLTPEERQARDESRRAQLDQALIDGVQAITDSESFKAVLAANAKFHSYSANNAMLIWAQCPTAERVAGFTTWKKLGRSVKKGEKGIMIYAPRKMTKVDQASGEEKNHVFFGIEHVFDITQTEGEEIPQLDCPTLTEEIGHEYYARLAQYAEAQGLTLTTDPAKGAGTEAMGYYSRSAKEVWIRQAPMAQMLKTGIHELAHHHDEEPNNREAKETIAEGVAFQVCAYFGIDTSERSFPYIAHWASAEGGPELIKRLLGHIQKLTKQMIAALSPAEPTDANPEPEPPAVSAAKPRAKRRTVNAA